MATQWIPPLPAGYEARWDPNQRAYFFINHHDKSTSWQDPRFTQQPGAHQAAAQFLSQQGYGARSQGAQNIPMQMKTVQFGSTTSSELITEDDEESDQETDFDHLFASTTGDQGKKVDIQKLHKIKQMFPSAPEDVIKSFLLRNNNVEVLTTNQLFEAGYKRETPASHPAPRVVDMSERLRAMFPTANKDLVEDILSQANNDEKKARAQLEAIGYKATYPATHRDTSRSTSPARAKSPAKKTTSPAKTSPAKPKLSDAEKTRLVNKVKGQFPKVEKSVVEMALQVCNYDESRVKAVLDRMADTSSKPSSSRPSTSSSAARKRSTSPSPLITHDLEPVVLSDDTRRPSTTSSKSSTTSTKSRSATPGSRPQSKSRSPTPKSSQSSTQQQRAKQVTQMSQEVLSSTIETLNQMNNHTRSLETHGTLTGSTEQISEHQSEDSRSKVIDDDKERGKDMLSSTLEVLSRMSNNILVPCCGHPKAILAGNQPVDSESNITSNLIGPDGTSNSESTDDRRSQVGSVVSRQPQSVSVSSYRTTAKGPDPSLRVGPNKELLLTEYTQAKGPNPQICQGPDPERVQGPQGASGPDRSLRCGPQADFHQGPGSRNLIVSSF